MGEVKEIINIFGGAAEGTAGGSFFRELIRVAVFIRRAGALGGEKKKRSLQTFLLIMYYSCPS